MKKRSWLYYLIVYVGVLLILLITTIIQHANGSYFVTNNLVPKEGSIFAQTFTLAMYKGKTFTAGPYFLDLAVVIFFPAFFSMVFFLIDLATGKFKGKKGREKEIEQAKYDKFTEDLGQQLSSTHKFNVEDFRHFREDGKFQNCLQKLYKIYKDGESEDTNYKLLLRKFDKNTKEKSAIEYLIAFTEKMRKAKETEPSTE